MFQLYKRSQNQIFKKIYKICQIFNTNFKSNNISFIIIKMNTNKKNEKLIP